MEDARKQGAKAQLPALRVTLEQINKIIGAFSDLGAASQWGYVDNLKALAKTGGVGLFPQPLPHPLSGIATDLSYKMQNLATRIEQTENDPKLRNVTTPAAITPELRRELLALDRAIKERMDEHAALRDAIELEIAEREKIVGAES